MLESTYYNPTRISLSIWKPSVSYYYYADWLVNGLLAGFPEEKAAKGNAFAPELEVAVDGNKYVLKSEAGETKLTINEEYEDKLPGGQVLKVTWCINI